MAQDLRVVWLRLGSFRIRCQRQRGIDPLGYPERRPVVLRIEPQKSSLIAKESAVPEHEMALQARNDQYQ